MKRSRKRNQEVVEEVNEVVEGAEKVETPKEEVEKPTEEVKPKPVKKEVKKPEVEEGITSNVKDKVRLLLSDENSTIDDFVKLNIPNIYGYVKTVKLFLEDEITTSDSRGSEQRTRRFVKSFIKNISTRNRYERAVALRITVKAFVDYAEKYGKERFFKHDINSRANIGNDWHLLLTYIFAKANKEPISLEVIKNNKLIKDNNILIEELGKL